MNLLNNKIANKPKRNTSLRQLQRLEFTIETVLFSILMALCFFALYLKLFTHKDLASTMDRSQFEQRSETTLGFSNEVTPIPKHLELGR
jgi:hypothetical protein